MTEDQFTLIRLSVPVRRNVCVQLADEIKKLTSSSLSVKEKVSQASKLIFELNLRHVCIYRIQGNEIVPVSQYGCDPKLPLNYEERKGLVFRAIETMNPCLAQLLPGDALRILFPSTQPPETKSELVLPIKNSRNEPIGVLELSSAIWYDFRKEEFDYYASLAEQLSELIEQYNQ